MIKGKLITYFCLDKNNSIQYDAISTGDDGYCNNQSECIWMSYKTHKSKKCNWGEVIYHRWITHVEKFCFQILEMIDKL